MRLSSKMMNGSGIERALKFVVCSLSEIHFKNFESSIESLKIVKHT